MQKGSKSKNMNLSDVAKLHGMTASQLMPQLRKGIKHEFEHTTSKVEARRIALDHLVEFPDYYDRLEKIEKMHLGGDMSMHLAPNGKPSNLTHEQWHLVRTPAFKAWFGDWENDPENSSKVVDENGEPLVVYHGSRAKGRFYTFEHIEEEKLDWTKDSFGFYFTDDLEYAKGYGEKIYQCFLNIRNPKISNNFEHTYLPYHKINTIINNGYDGMYFDGNIDEDIKGIIYKKEIIAFYSNQIKLADGTNTTFDGNSPDIRFKKGGRTIAQTPALKKDRIYGSKVNKEGSASSGVKRITFNAKLTKAIKNKVEEYNERYPDSKVTLNVGKAVVRRGMGAYSKSHRPTISGGAPNSRQAWGLARLNKFLMKKSGQKVKKSYIQDDDLL